MKFKNIVSVLSGLLMLAGFSACDGEKDLVIIEGELPIKTSTLYMVGDATPNGWNIDTPTPLTASEEDPLVFTWEGQLNAGEMKLCLTTGSWDNAFIRPVNNGDEIGKDGIPETKFDMHAGDPDNKWRIVDAGVYNLRFDLRNWTVRADYVRELDPVQKDPIQAENLYMVGDATPVGWNIDSPFQLEKKSDYIFVYEGPLAKGEIKACMETGSWSAEFIRPEIDHCSISKAGVEDDAFIVSVAPDYKWYVAESGIYRLTFDLQNWTIAAEYTGEYTPAAKLYMIGTATEGGWSWDNATEIEATATDNEIFVWEGDLMRGSLKASLEKDFDAEFYRPAAADVEISDKGVADHAMVLTTSPDDQWKVTVAGKYRLTFNTKAMTFNAEYLSEATVTATPLYMIGTATSGGWSLDNATEIAPVDGQEGVYSWSGKLTVGTFKASPVKSFDDPFYRPSSNSVEVSENGVSANDMVFTKDPDDQWNVVTEGNYELTFDTNAMTINVKYLD